MMIAALAYRQVDVLYLSAVWFKEGWLAVYSIVKAPWLKTRSGSWPVSASLPRSSLLQRLDDTEALRIIFKEYGRSEMVYDSLKTPEKWNLLETLRQVSWLLHLVGLWTFQLDLSMCFCAIDYGNSTKIGLVALRMHWPLLPWSTMTQC